ncbi:cell cycle checkpoint protein RAD17 isoform X2 [Girardinichthys multiradiatus]|uniref:cell cycle checkpoint protein RAD17 isoform X2 n=1 Tax=Girardinichthys multiradiatus TaxID=208333 RepID=UPI001FABA814|nr:cell cycle checkpoint protein RAD17 isoform X2 [Girardinichthys multiradiatus]
MKKSSLEDTANSRRVHNWVDPSFSNPSDERFCSGKREDKQFWDSQPECQRPRKRKKDRSGFLRLTKSIKNDPDEPWVDRYSPCSQGELAVHKKKIEEVEKWMRGHTNPSKGGILILTGPSGSGKTATVQVLSLELGIRVQEWTNPSSVEPYYGSLPEWRLKGSSCSSQLAQFQEFLLRVNKYKCLKMKGDREAPDNRLILVEDFPNQFYRQPCGFHDILRFFVKNSQCPLVFIVSGSRSGEGSLHSLFPKDIQEELHISCISFNPVAPTTMMKVLKNILYMETEKRHKSLYVPDKSELEMLCSGTSGDIRSVINSLQFCCLPDRGLFTLKKPPAVQLERTVSLSKQRRKRAISTRKQEEHQAIGGKDVSVFLFRALGKILHCKRGNCESANATKGASGPGLPFHLLHHHREVLLVQPESVVERSQTSGEFFSLCLHQNYLDFFSEIEDVDRACEYLSDADLLTGNWTIRHIIGDYGSSVATRGLIHSNSCQLSVGFKPLHKPSWCLVSKKHQNNSLAAQSLFRSFHLTPVSLLTQLLPYLAKLCNTTRSQAEIAIIQDVGQMSLRRCSGRIKLENLGDKEMGQEVEEEEEEHCRTEKDLQVSQSQLTTNQVLLEEEDLIIEEYESD